MSRVFITGITGFIGARLAQTLIQQSENEVFGLIRFSANENSEVMSKLPKEVILKTGNLIDHHRIRKIIEEVKPNYILHVGACTPVRYSFESPIEYINVNYTATVNLIHAALEIPKFEKFLFASTMEVYGWQDQRTPFSEDAVLNPSSPYAVSKVAADKYLRMAGKAYNLPYIVLRPCNTYGRQVMTGYITEYLITSMLQNKKPHIGTPEAVRDLMYATDHVNAYLTAMHSDVTSGTFNFGWGSSMNMIELAEEIRGLLDYEGSIEYGWPDDYPTRPVAEEYLSLDASKARKILDWTPKVSLKDGLKKTADFWRQKLGL